MQDFQDGMTKTVNGATYKRVNGVWQLQADAQPAQPAVSYIPPNPNSPRAQERAQEMAYKAEDQAMQRDANSLAREKFEYEKQQDAAKAGSPADQTQSAIASLQRVIQQIDAITADASDNGGLGETGFLGARLAGWEGSPAYDLREAVKTIDANLAFDRLQAMRDASPTGGALGQVTEKELELLKASVANLNPNQSLENFLKQAAIARGHYTTMLSRLQPEGADVSRSLNEIAAPGQTQIEAATTVKTQDDPRLAGVNEEYRAMLAGGAPAGDLIRFLRSKGVSDPKVFRSVVEQVKFREANPNVPFENYDVEQIDDMTVPMGAIEQITTAAAMSPIGAGIINAADAMTLGTMDNLSADPERTRNAMALSSDLNPNAAFVGQVGGSLAAMLGGEAALAARGMQAGLGRGMLADGLYGLGYGAGSDESGSRVDGALLGAGAGVVGSAAGQAIVRGIAGAARGVKPGPVTRLADDGQPMTLGQMVSQSGRVGEAIKGIEDRLSGFPVVGDMVNARRTEGYQAFNSRAFDKALEPIEESVGNKVGDEAVEEAHGLVSRAFARALDGKAVSLDTDYIDAMRSPLGKLRAIKRDGLGEEIVGRIEEATREHMGDDLVLSGEGMQALLEELRDIRLSYASDPLRKKIGDAVRGIEDATVGLFERQAPEVMPEFRRAQQAYRRLNVVADAVNRAKNANEQMFTPGQLGMADRANAKKFDGQIRAASGSGEFHNFHKDAQAVLPNKVPDSGTAGRYILGAAALGAAGGAGEATTGTGGGLGATGMGLMGALGLLYSKKGQQGLAKVLIGKRPAAVSNAGRSLQASAPTVGRLAGGSAIAVSE